MKTNAQFSAMRKGALDISLYPLSYAGGEVAETNIGLMPALVPSYEVGAAVEERRGRQACSPRSLDEKGIVVAQLDLAGRRRRQPRHAAGRSPRTPRA